MKLNVVSAWRRYSARVTVHAAEIPGATGAALRSAPGQAPATLLGGPPPRAAGFLPACVPTNSWVGQSWVPGTEFSPYGFSRSLRVRQSFHVTNSSLLLEFNNKIQTGTRLRNHPTAAGGLVQTLTEAFS